MAYKLVGLSVALLSAAAIALYLWWTALSPEYSSEYATGVAETVTISLDDRARPYVQAQSWNDAFFAQGWLHASNRLWQMDMFRRAGKGRIAQAIGPPGLETDIELWRAGVPELAQRLQSNASDTLKRYIESYVAGINAWLATNSPKPPEYRLTGLNIEPWRAEDVFALGALMAYQSANNQSNELVRLALIAKLGAVRASIFIPGEAPASDPMLGALALADVHRVIERLALTSARSNSLFAAPSFGSNSWAVAPDRARDNYALFAFDSHDSLGIPNLTYDVHLFVDDEQIRGNSVPGLLGVINGYNEFMAWGFTNIGDSQDLYVETIDENDPLRLKGRNGWYTAQTQEVAIPVKGQQSHRLQIILTENGRLVSTDPPLSARWAPLEPHGYGLDALIKLNRATSYQAFTAAMSEFAAPSANVTYADTTGRIAQRTIGLLPIRGTGAGLVPLDGSEPGTEWQGMLHMNTLPAQESAGRGFLQAANRPLHDGLPLISADNAPGYRVRRIAQFLDAGTEHTVETMGTLQTDHLNLQAKRLLPRMLQSLRERALSEQEQQAFDLLSVWSTDPIDKQELVEPLFFAQWYQNLLETLFLEPLGSELYQQLLARSYLINEAVDNQLLQGRSAAWPINAALIKSFSQTVTGLWQPKDVVPSRKLTWGQSHQLSLRHTMSGAFPGSEWLFDRGPYAASGGNATVGRARYSYKRPFALSAGATSRIIVKLARPMEVYMIAPAGQSGIASSANYNDQTEHWLRGELDRIPADFGPRRTTVTLNPRHM